MMTVKLENPVLLGKVLALLCTIIVDYRTFPSTRVMLHLTDVSVNYSGFE